MPFYHNYVLKKLKKKTAKNTKNKFYYELEIHCFPQKKKNHIIEWFTIGIDEKYTKSIMKQHISRCY